MRATIGASFAEMVHGMVDELVIKINWTVILGHCDVHVVQRTELGRFDAIMVPYYVPDTVDVGCCFRDLVSYVWTRKEGRYCV